jgi:hypothetical protein
VRFTDFQALSFDCYGTLINWEGGIAAVLSPWAKRRGLTLDDDQPLTAYSTHEATAEAEHPTKPYPGILARSLRALGGQLGTEVSDADATALATSVPDWPASGCRVPLNGRVRRRRPSRVTRPHQPPNRPRARRPSRHRETLPDPGHAPGKLAGDQRSVGRSVGRSNHPAAGQAARHGVRGGPGTYLCPFRARSLSRPVGPLVSGAGGTAARRSRCWRRCWRPGRAGRTWGRRRTAGCPRPQRRGTSSSGARRSGRAA